MNDRGSGLGNGARPLLIAGAGGFAREAAQAVAAINSVRPTWHLLGFLDDNVTLVGSVIDGVPVVGTIDDVADHPEAAVVVCTGRPTDFGSRRRIVERLHLEADRFGVIVHPSADIAESTAVGPGSVLLAGVVTTCCVSIGSHVAVMPHVTLTHNDVVEDFATIASGVCRGGGVRIGAGAYVGAGALVRERLRVGAGALVGMGALVMHDVPDGEVWYGAPARPVRDVEAPVVVTNVGEPK